MRKLICLALVLVVAFVFVPAAFAGCPTGQFLRKIGSTQTGTAVISTRGHDVRLILITATSSDAVAGIHDVTTTGATALANITLEPGVTAGNTILIPRDGFFDTPLRFDTGITFIDDGNVQAITVYECR